MSAKSILACIYRRSKAFTEPLPTLSGPYVHQSQKVAKTPVKQKLCSGTWKQKELGTVEANTNNPKEGSNNTMSKEALVGFRKLTCIQDSGEICITVQVAPIWVQNLLIFINMPNKTNKSSQIPIFGIIISSRRTCGQDLSFTSWQLTLVGSWRLPGGYV